jgi:alkanesulfonate monooxygenase SsuD/methylene tetrahydromethanopterin reductase-like flavin-dependent oxidoreductase (luciferase family)
VKFGIFFIGDNYPTERSNADFYAELLDQVGYAEELGFDSVWFAEHHFHEKYGVCPSPPVLMAAAAQRTRRIRLGSGVTLLPFHNPLRVAEDYAMVDLLSQGRLDFGAGRAFLRHEFVGFQISVEESRERFDEALDIILKAWTGERFSYEGKYYRVRDTALSIVPVQRPHPPVWIAAVSPETPVLAARKGFPVLLVSAGFKAADSKMGRTLGATLQAFGEAYVTAGHGEARPELPIVYYTHVGKSRAQIREDTEKHITRYFRTVPIPPPPEGEPLTELTRKYEELRKWNQTVTYDQLLEQNVILFGDPVRCREKIQVMQEAGITSLLCFMNFGGLVHEKVRESMRLFAEEVMPYFRP